MRNLSFLLRGTQLVLLSCSIAFLPATADLARANDEPPARQIAEFAFSEETMIAIWTASEDEVRQKMRDQLSQITDVTAISDRDMDTFLRVFIDINARGLVAGLRRAFENELAKLPENDLKIMLACARKLLCKRENLSKETMTFIGELPAFGKAKGEEIGRALGEATTAKVLEKLKSMDESEFDNRDELLRILSLKTFRI